LKIEKMAKYKIAWLPGDGIGRDVMDAARIVLDAINIDAEYIHGDIGWEFWKKEGNALPDRTIQLLKETDCALFGAITSKPKDEARKELKPKLKKRGHEYYSPIVRIRQLFDLYANVRPCKAYKGNPLNYRNDIDLVIFRENTEGLYSGVEFYPLPNGLRKELEKNTNMERFRSIPSQDISFSSRIFTKKGCRRIIRKAFEYAKKEGRGSVTVVEKPNVIRETSGMMLREARKVAKGYDIPLWEANVDAMCMWLIKNPQNYSVLVTSNLFGDIISDLSAQLVGGLGFACSGNIGDDYALFEPTHGSAPKYAGLYKVNPTAMLLSVKMMIEWLGEKKEAKNLERAISITIQEGKVRTYDMGGSSSTLEVAEEVVKNLE
jgi:3-isopropylmalate dehydrogenase